MGVAGLAGRRIRLPRWAVTAVTLSVLVMSALSAGLWVHHHVWVKHHRPELYDEYRAGYAAGLQVPDPDALDGMDDPCVDAMDSAYPQRIRPQDDGHVNYATADDLFVFYFACQDGESHVPGGPRHRISELLYGDD
jgi:hypothetical protein